MGLPPVKMNGWWSRCVYTTIFSRYKFNRMGESKQPRRIPAVVLKDSLADCSRELYCWRSRKIISVSKCPNHLCRRRILTACSVITVGQKAGCTCTQAAAVSSTGVSTRHTWRCCYTGRAYLCHWNKPVNTQSERLACLFLKAFPILVYLSIRNKETHDVYLVQDDAVVSPGKDFRETTNSATFVI